MRTRILAFMLIALSLLTTPALARFVVMDANFDGRTAGSQLGRGGAFQGEPVPGPWDRLDDVIVAEGPGDMAVEFPDAQILGPSELYFAMRSGLAPVDGLLTLRWTVTPDAVDDYEISVRGADLETEVLTIIFSPTNRVFGVDADGTLSMYFGGYFAGTTLEFMLELDLNQGTFSAWRDGVRYEEDNPLDLAGGNVGSLVFSHPDDGNATGSLTIDDIQLDWRPGTAPWLIEATFSDKPAGEIIATRGAYYGEPVALGGTDARVEIGLPLGNKALVLSDDDVVTQMARFEFLGGVEPRNQPVSISFAIAADQLEEHAVYVREQGLATAVFLSIRLRENGDVEFSDLASGGSPYLVHAYLPGVPITVELHFEPVLDVYSLWWDGERLIHRRAHGIVDEEVGSVLFGTLDDPDHDGTLYVDRIRAYTLGQPLGVEDAPTPLAPAILLGAAPNPFNPATEIRFELPDAAPVTLDIFDSRGRLVRRLVDETLPAGLHSPIWHGLDQQGRRVASGVYHARVDAGGFGTSTSMTLVK